jgi:putative SOS response-associated peptidase YedK
MCGRFTATWPSYADLVRALDLGGMGVASVDEQALLYRPRWNVAPMEHHWVVRLSPERGDRELAPAAWGFLPGAARGSRPSYPLINARGESVARQPAFKDAFARRRCVVPVDGFYEWIGPPKARRPVWFHPPDGGLLRLAGLWGRARGRGDDAPALEFTILTTAANDVVAPAHDRMPVVLAPDDVDAWLHAGEDAALELVHPAPHDALVGTPVSPRANKVGNDDPSCLEPYRADAHAADDAPTPGAAPRKAAGGETLSLFGDEPPAAARRGRRSRG